VRDAHLFVQMGGQRQGTHLLLGPHPAHRKSAADADPARVVGNACTGRSRRRIAGGSSHNVLLILRLGVLVNDRASTAQALVRQWHAGLLFHLRRNGSRGSLTVVGTRPAAPRLGIEFGITFGEWCGLSLVGAQCVFEFLTEPFNFCRRLVQLIAQRLILFLRFSICSVWRRSLCPLIQTTVTETAGFVQGVVKNSRIHKAFDAVNSYKGLDNTATILVSCVPTVRDTFLYTVPSAPGMITTVFEHEVSRRGPTVRKKRRSTSLVRLPAECDNYLLSLLIKESR